MVFKWSERSGRCRPPPHLQKCRKTAPPPPKKCREASTNKQCHKAAPPKKCRKKGRLKKCSKCSPPQKCCEAALQKLPCYVEVAPTKNVKAAPPLDKCCKAATPNASPQPPLRFRSRPPLTLKPSLFIATVLLSLNEK